MQLVLIQNANGDKLRICGVPRFTLSSSSPRHLLRFMRDHADKLFGIEGRDYRVCQTKPGSLIPIMVNQLVKTATGVEYGQCLVIE